ncbi:MAG TPA: TonB family protein [Thermoanaerobaculia bacterium]|nr:TonB family protein [Thermoanaerobaculia bacterium]
MALLNEHIDGKYEILGKMREGGMGAIYKVRHRLLDEVRVVKVIRSQAGSAGEAADRFLHEAKAAIRLRHPNVAVLHDFAVTEDGQAFIVMEHIDGWNLLEVLGGYGPPPVALTLEIARQSLKALGYLHRHRIVHRDVSPDNLMLTRDVDGNPLVKLIDLGIAKTLEGQGGLTTTGVFLGKPRYGSPERFGGGAWDARSDLYSFGVVLYELLTGRSPVSGSDPTALMAGHLFRPPLDFSETDAEGRVPPELRALVLKSLAKKPEDRMATAEDFVWELTMLQDRFPLGREDLEGVWGVLLPLGPGSERVVQETPGSTQDRLNLELGMATTPPAGLLTAEADVIPFSAETRVTPAARQPEPTRRVGEDLDATWASRPLRTGRTAEPAKPAPVPAAPIRGAAVAKASRAPVAWIATGVVVLALAAGGFWWSRRPAPVVSSPPAPVPDLSTVAPAAAPASSVQPATEPEATRPEATEPEAASLLIPDRPAAKRRSPLPEEPAPAPGPLEPMKPGDLIRAGQPGVDAPEIRDLPSYGYPEAARGSGKKVSIRVGVLVDETGTVIDARIREGKESSLGFNEAAMEAAHKARFFPATRDGVPGKMWTELLLDFSE